MSTVADLRNAYDAAVKDDATKATAVTTAQTVLNAAQADKATAGSVVTTATTPFAQALHSSQFQMLADYSLSPPVIYLCTDGVTIQEIQVPDLSTVALPDPTPAPAPTPAPSPTPATT